MINRVVLVGRLTKDPELKYTPNGIAVATFTLAVNRQFSNPQGEREADFLNIVVWRKAAENVANFLKKGSLAGVDGRIQVRTYEQDGRRQYFTEIVADTVQFLEPKGSSGSGGGNGGGRSNDFYGAPPREPQGSSYGGGNQNQRQNSNQGFTRVDDDPFAGSGQIDISDDDLPF
ncbi:single-stranded DNA-binding protein [Neobacillus kokaensis]|uniref:Single-stranded DNA-binding protein n=1 Tax=Neobacillus kokaensis TaxID=2759023 RepID=A0ABQ3N392_9BACI|nr:single-stranded DNA-binding protein [Neobacillus kokaensis]GHH98107.1 single-stranded DNA-binding protein [Neobacillus kokaensis]